MRLPKTMAAGLLAVGMCRPAVAASPPLDRPSPPPCSADGKCLANPLTYGWYETRWRRWPLEAPIQMPTGKPAPLPAAIQQEIPPFEAPPAEKEDQKAPEPSAPRPEETGPITRPSLRTPGPGGATQGPATTPQSTTPGTPGGPQRGLPPLPSPTTTPLVPPGGPAAQPGINPLNRPLVPPNSLLNRSSPTSDLDPPPTLPFGPQPFVPSIPVREANQPVVTPIHSRATNAAQSPSNDPPPAPPISLASSEN